MDSKKLQQLKRTRFCKETLQNLRLNSEFDANKTKKKQNNLATIEKVPIEILLNVFSYLDASSALNCAQVCSLWNRLVQDNELWKFYYKKHILYETTVTTKQKLGSKPTLPVTQDGNWKSMFFKKCKLLRNKRFAALDKRNAYTGVTNRMDENLWKLGCKFELELKCKKKSYLFIQTKRKTFDSVTTVQWTGLTEWPPLQEIAQVRIYSLTPLIYNKERKPIFNSPVQKSLLLQEDSPKFDKILATTDQVVLRLTNKNVLFASWKLGGEIAFVSVGLHHYKLLAKCLKSTYDMIYDIPHKVVDDDVDMMYGLHGYKCHLHIHTMDASLWNEKFNCLYSEQSKACSDPKLEEYVTFEPRGYEMNGYLPYNISFKWTTDIFKGSVPNVVFITITMCDINDEVMWATAIPVCIRTSETKEIDFAFDGDEKSFEFVDHFGHVKIFFKEERKKAIYITKILLRLKLDSINKWFGTNYKS